jgi:glycosyltransferase involved in cell wall biosynthesis
MSDNHKDMTELEHENEKLKDKLRSLNKENSTLEKKFTETQNLYNNVVNSRSWKITGPLRVLIAKSSNFKTNMKNKKTGSTLSKKQIRYQRDFVFKQSEKISILVPVYNTDAEFFKKMIKSVVDQTYSNWQLCLADASDTEHSYIKVLVDNYVTDQRIVYKKISNKGIAENTNECAKLADGKYLALLDHDDIIAPNALFEVMKDINDHNPDVIYTDEDKIDKNDRHSFPFFKPDWSPDLLYSQMYICHLLVFKSALFNDLDGFNKEYDGSQDYDLMLRLSEKTNKISHISKLLYSWRLNDTSTSVNPDSKPYANNAGLNALNEHLKRKYKNAYATESENLYVYDTRFKIDSEIKASIIIPTKDNVGLLDVCVDSILKKTSYKNYEILILNNNSEKEETFQWFKDVVKRDSRVKVIDALFDFNWSKLNNFGMSKASGEVYVFLNNDTEIISEDWLERLSENAVRDEIGTVGALLLYEDNLIQHAGVVVGMGGWADHVYKGVAPAHFYSPYVSSAVNRDVLAVTGACMAVSKKTIEQIGNFNEEFIIGGSDVEICLRAYEKGLFNLYDANVKLYHLESKTRDSFIPETDFDMSAKHYARYFKNGDPFYNINLSLNSTTPIEGKTK